MNRSQLLFIALLLVAVAGTSTATDLPIASKYDSRIQYVDYNESDVVVVRAYPGTATQIVLAPGEEVVDMASGFVEGWEVKDSRNNLYLKAKSLKGSEGANLEPQPGKWDTNLIVTTSKRVYAFQLVLVKPREDGAPGVGGGAAYRIAFRFPADEVEKAKHAADKKAAIDKLAVTAPPRNWNYTMQAGKSSDGIAPTRAYDDGRFTFLRFPNNREFPAAFEVADDKSESLVNTHIDPKEPDVLVVHRVASQLVLRLGSAVVAVYNEAYDADGLAPVHGTTVPGVARSVRGEGEVQ